MFHIPLGWMQLKKERLRFAVAISGVAFAVILIFMQLGFRESLYDSAVRFHNAMIYDIALVSPQSSFIARPEPFSRRRLYQALSVEGVEGALPLYVSQAVWKNPFEHSTRIIFVMGFDPAKRVFDLPGVSSNLGGIKLRDGFLFDRASRPEFGPVAARFEADGSVSAEVNDHEIDVRGLFELGTSFGIDGSLLTSDTNFLRLFPSREPGLIDLGLVRLREGADAERVRRAMRQLLPNDVLVLTKAQYAQRERDYWSSSTAIGYVFTFGVVVGLLIGGIIVYQILFADVSDHLPEYATLKAMGYSNHYLSAVVLQQAFILATCGFLPAVVTSLWLYHVVGEATHLPMVMTLERSLGVLGLAIAMCSLAGLVALRKVRAADPAEVF